MLLVACQSVPQNPEPVKVVDNPIKDAYVDKLEQEAQEGAAALLVAKENVTGKGLPLVVLTAERLAGIRQPTPPLITKYTKAIDDQKALKVEQDKASKVDQETTALYGMVDDLDRENRDLKAALASQAKERAWDDLRGKFLMLAGGFAIAGAGLLVLSTFTGGKGKGGGAILLGLSVFFGGAPFVIRDVVESPWFPYATAGLTSLAALWAMWAYHQSHKHLKDRLTPPQ